MQVIQDNSRTLEVFSLLCQVGDDRMVGIGGHLNKNQGREFLRRTKVKTCHPSSMAGMRLMLTAPATDRAPVDV